MHSPLSREAASRKLTSSWKSQLMACLARRQDALSTLCATWNRPTARKYNSPALLQGRNLAHRILDMCFSEHALGLTPASFFSSRAKAPGFTWNNNQKCRHLSSDLANTWFATIAFQQSDFTLTRWRNFC